MDRKTPDAVDIFCGVFYEDTHHTVVSLLLSLSLCLYRYVDRYSWKSLFLCPSLQVFLSVRFFLSLP
ncbi:hypothetical protein CSUI_003514, partial [Cystoisospora suis]